MVTLLGLRAAIEMDQKSSFAKSAARGTPEMLKVSPGSSGGMSDRNTSVRTGPRGPLYASGAGDEGSSVKRSSRSAGTV